MQKQSKQTKISIKSVLCVSILIFGLSIFSSMRLNATTVSYDPHSYSALTPHDPISISSDSGFLGFPGSGTELNPYTIEGYNITTTNSVGILIIDTTKYFTVRNCYVDARDYGIYIQDVADSTAIVMNNTCNNNDWNSIYISRSGNTTVANNSCNNNYQIGIYLSESDSGTVVNNTCNNNYDHGIVISYSDNSTVVNNTCSNNDDLGIYIYLSGSSTVANNTCNNNHLDGIRLRYSGSSTITNNTCSNNNDFGILLWDSGSLTVANNTCKYNYYGIYLDNSDYCVFTYNLLQENIAYGVCLEFNSDNNLFHHNNFYNNLGGFSQAYDDEANNFWYDSSINKGNYWSDWSGTGSYTIEGFLTDVYDLYPLDEPTVYLGPPVITNVIHSPATPTELDTISINAIVTNPHGVQSVTLHYRVNGGTWIEVSMTHVSGDLYSVTIGSFAVSDTIEYYITAVDDSIYHNEATEDNSGLYYSFTIDSSDITGPTINDIVHSPATPTELDTVIINATVTDASGVQSVTLHYRINVGSWLTISMTLVSGDVYSATIGPFAVSDNIDYYITAVDDSIHHNEATEDNSGQYFDIFVGSSDVTGPTIENVTHSPSSPTELDTIFINATVTDASGIYNVTLHYSVNGGAWIEVSMTLISGDTYSIFGGYSAGTNIEYYISSVDDSINFNEAIEDNGGIYYTIIVGSSDVIGPTIDTIIHSPATPTELDTININATVTDASGVQNVALTYRINDGSWQIISMTLVNGDIYSVTIGSFAAGDTIEYYITAVDNSINFNEATEDNSGVYYSFTVSEVIPEFHMFSPLLQTLTFLFLGFGLVVLQRRKK